MRKLILTALAGAAFAFATPQLASAVPLAPAALGAAADSVTSTPDVHHRSWHHRGRHWKHHRYYRRHHHRHHWR
jgi:hypothetical protein